ncbi:nitroreductase family protein [Methylopila sp. Yamaguchi]|uniref:nitroreductase family protein n=1 Tax=Methylopila sp. Yamaguchi TaxID=1437817 RepID=UPI000CB522A6|nr:nitroreductase family protein [Methylopila sp. Yamaguchi]GBD46801.1 nitroreductase [Methylopila sp. Yamaguchi]
MTLTADLPAEPAFADARADAEAALHARYRELVAGASAHWNETLGVLLGHRSVRSYRPTPLPDGVVEILVAAAQSAPTSSNAQAWSVVAVDDPEQKARLSRLAGDQKHIREAPLLLVWVADLARAAALADEQGTGLEGGDYLEGFLIAAFDAALAAQNALVAAESLGLGTCYIGALRNHPVEVAREVGLPPRAAVVFGLTVGYEDPETPAAVKPRLPQAAVLHRNRYALDAQHPAIGRHDAHSLDFRAEQRLDPTPWTVLAVDRLRTVAALKGRHVLRQALEALGFRNT